MNNQNDRQGQMKPAEKIIAIPNLDGSNSKHIFGKKVGFLKKDSGKIMGYTYEGAKLKLIISNDSGNWSVFEEDLL